MSDWLINIFGSREVNEVFLLLTFGPLPFWVGIVLYPNEKWTRLISSPFFIPTILSVIYLFLVWKAWEIGGPNAPETQVKSVRGFIEHPLIFLVLWAHLQMANLFVGTVLLQDARKNKLSIRVELALCWIFAPLAVLAYSIRRFIRVSILPKSND